MGLPFYYIETFQNISPRVKHLKISQKATIWSLYHKNVKMLCYHFNACVCVLHFLRHCLACKISNVTTLLVIVCNQSPV